MTVENKSLAQPAPIPVPIQRWPGRSTSGRYVYKGTVSGLWFWQCDLHSEDPVPDDQWGRHATHAEALAGALHHAATCPYVAAPNGTPHA